MERENKHLSIYIYERYMVIAFSAHAIIGSKPRIYNIITMKTRCRWGNYLRYFLVYDFSFTMNNFPTNGRNLYMTSNEQYNTDIMASLPASRRAGSLWFYILTCTTRNNQLETKTYIDTLLECQLSEIII